MPKLPVIISKGQSRNPEKRGLEQALAAQLAEHDQLDVVVMPHIYDLTPQSEGYQVLSQIEGDFVMISWLYSRSCHWIMDRNGIHGHAGDILLSQMTDEDELDDELEDELEDEKERVINQLDLPNRKIYSLEFGASEKVEDFVDEVLRIAAQSDLLEWIQGKANEEAMDRFLSPANNTALANHGQPPALPILGQPGVTEVQDPGTRRWYPVIDFSRCTNCMECIDFCLFGVYGVDRVDTILVDQPDNCRKGCPACSRVCPENAIVFPQHKTPAIAGAPADAGGLKIDLSLLFGAPDAQDVAARERDEQLMLAGRSPVGQGDEAELEKADFANISMERRQSTELVANADPLDALIDDLDALDL
ncbi:MAG: ferredoxin family protein [Planctomycetaceae bacterium]